MVRLNGNRSKPVIYILLRLIFGDTIAFLDFTLELVTATIHLIEFIVRAST